MALVSLAVRVFVDGALQSTERFERTLEELERVIPELAEKHATLGALRPTMIEIEFLDEPDPNERYFRIGTDWRGMRQPFGFKLDPTRH